MIVFLIREFLTYDLLETSLLMPIIKHRFLDHKVNSLTEILILGTFNPDTENNEAEIFYGRSRNFLWKILSVAFGHSDLKNNSREQKLDFMTAHKIDFIDLIAEIEVDAGDETNYRDDFIDNKVRKWKDVLDEIKDLPHLKKIIFTRKTFIGIPNIAAQLNPIVDYCNMAGIEFQALLSPTRGYTEKKQETWTYYLKS